MNIKDKVKGNYRRILLFLFDIACFVLLALAYYVATHFIATEGSETSHINVPDFLFNSAILLVTTMVCRLLWGVYNYIWRYTSTEAFLRLVLADICAGIVSVGVSYVSGQHIGMWFFVSVASLSALMALSARFVYRLIY